LEEINVSSHFVNSPSLKFRLSQIFVNASKSHTYKIAGTSEFYIILYQIKQKL